MATTSEAHDTDPAVSPKGALAVSLQAQLVWASGDYSDRVSELPGQRSACDDKLARWLDICGDRIGGSTSASSERLCSRVR